MRWAGIPAYDVQRNNKRRKLSKSGKVSKANLLANKVNNLTCDSRKRCFSRVSEAPTRELSAAVKPNKHKIDWASSIFYNADSANKFFADIATDSDYNLEHVNALRPSLCYKSDSNFSRILSNKEFYVE